MRNKIYPDVPKTLKTTTGKWVRIFPDEGDGYRLYDPLDDAELGRILFDADDHWVYDGTLLTVDEQEEIAGAISGHEQEIIKLLRSYMRTEEQLCFFPKRDKVRDCPMNCWNTGRA